MAPNELNTTTIKNQIKELKTKVIELKTEWQNENKKAKITDTAVKEKLKDVKKE
ncbi:hypothetical protein [Bacillus cereus]|uniref:hypothetical protein n=1 Tax=Bacillus cereus TaxID=1396 RepID=UPI003EE1D9FB